MNSAKRHALDKLRHDAQAIGALPSDMCAVDGKFCVVHENSCKLQGNSPFLCNCIVTLAAKKNVVWDDLTHVAIDRRTK